MSKAVARADALAAVVVSALKVALAPLVARVAVLEAADLSKEVTMLRERLAVVETRPPVPGPAGQDGAPGPPGRDGAAGKPGLEWRGVFVEGQTYDHGQLVTVGGSAWHCNETTTTRPSDGSKAWTLMVKRGRDGKDGKDGAVGPPGPPGEDWQQVYDKTRRR